MGVYGFGRQGHYQSVFSVYIKPTYKWFPWVWYDLRKDEYVIGLGKPLNSTVLKHRVSKKEAEGFRKLVDE